MKDDNKKSYRPNIGTGKLVWQVTPYGPADVEANKLGTGSPIAIDYEGGYAALNGDDLDLHDDVRVHRIMRFDEYGLEHVVRKQALAFVTHHYWEDDDHEGYLAREMKTKEGIERVAKILHENNVAVNPVLTAATLQMLTYSLHMQSWTQAEEKSEMWDDYSPADRTGVRVTTSLGKLRRMGHLFVNSVIYRKRSMNPNLAAFSVPMHSSRTDLLGSGYEGRDSILDGARRNDRA